MPTAAAAGPRPLSPGQIRSAYALPLRGARNQTIAVVSAFDDATLQSDLAAYDAHFKLPACTTANGCLQKLNQQGKTSPMPSSDTSGGTWLTESALGVETAHALCQSCRIMLVQASFADTTDLSVAVQSAARAGAGVIVTTFTPIEQPDSGSLASLYDDPHSAIVAATGDGGYSGSLNFPSSLPNVLAVGGTSLRLGAGERRGSESAWSGSVSGCSLYESAPAWQTRIMTTSGCVTNRAGADLSAEADPGTLFYASNIQGTSGGGWYQAQGTSVAAPIIGAAIGLAGSAGEREAQMLYARQQSDPGAFHDITTGNNSSGCTTAICRAGRGWDGPTGFGTPAGLEAFLPGGPAISPRHPRVALSAAHDRLATSRRWTVRLTVANANPFRIGGEVTLRRTLRLGGRWRTIVFATHSVRRGSLAAGGLTLTIGRSQRRLLRAERRLGVWAFARVAGASGRAVTVRRELTLTAP